MFYLLFKQFIRAKSTIAALVLLLLAGLLSLATGRQHIQKQKENTRYVSALQKEHIQRNVQYFNNEFGLLMYYVRFALINETDPLNALSVGQRDVNSSVQNINIRNLEAQRYDTDLSNPVSLHAGNLDLGFVIIYLFPLVIIAFGYNLLSEEKESGTLKIWAVQSQYPIRFFQLKFFIRLLFVFTVLLVLFVTAIFWLNLSLNERFFAFAAVSFLYLLCWFAITYWVVSWEKSSSLNAVVMVSIWVLLVIIIPASINNYINNRYPLPEAQNVALTQRDGYHKKWDISRELTMQGFYKHYPQFAKYGVPPGTAFSWLWYYAMQQMGDDDAQEATKQLYDKLRKRNKVAETIAEFIPGLHVQQVINDVSRAGLQNQLLFLDSTARFHEKMRLYFYPKIFDNKPVNQENWSLFDVSFFRDTTPVNWVRILLPLIVFITLLYGLAYINFIRKPLDIIS